MCLVIFIRFLTPYVVHLSSTLQSVLSLLLLTESCAFHLYYISSLAEPAIQLAARPNNPTLTPNHLSPTYPKPMHSQWMAQIEVRTPSHEWMRLTRIAQLTLTQLGTPTIAPLPLNDTEVTTVPLRCCLLSCATTISSDGRADSL